MATETLELLLQLRGWRGGVLPVPAGAEPNLPHMQGPDNHPLFSVVSDNDYLMFDIPGPAEPWAEEEQKAGRSVPWSQVMEFPLELWAHFFQGATIHITALLPWVPWALERLLQGDCWDLAVVEGKAVTCWCSYGLDEEVLVQELQSCLPGSAETFVWQLMATATELWAEKLCQNLARHSPCWEGDSMVTSSTDSSSLSTSPGGSLRASWLWTPADGRRTALRTSLISV